MFDPYIVHCVIVSAALVALIVVAGDLLIGNTTMDSTALVSDDEVTMAFRCACTCWATVPLMHAQI
jgi:hypothetical protein